MAFITTTAGYWFLILFGISMILVTYLFARWKRSSSKEGFLVAGRNVGWFTGGASIAASWIWAPALFVSVQMAYQSGLAGIFWFTFPNIIALAIFAFFAPKIREKFPQGYTLPQYIKEKLKSERVHKIYLFAFFFYQLMAVAVQLFAGGSLVTLLTGIPILIIMPILAGISLTYTLISGLKASMITDLVQMGMILGIGALIITLSTAVGGPSSITGGFVGIGSKAVVAGFGDFFREMFDPAVAFSFGIVTSIGLIAGAISDQQYWQRSFAIKKNQLRKAFVFGALLFGIVPIALSSLGFMAVSMDIQLPAGVDVSMIGVQTVAELLPSWALFLFVVMLLAGLSSTLDSGLSAASSLWVTDVAKAKTDRGTIRSARYAMIGVALLGLGVALAALYIPGFGLQHLWWIFNTVAACVMVPTVLSLYWNRLSEKGVFWGVFIAFVVGIPLFVYSNVLGSAMWVVGSSLFVVAVSTISCLAFPKPMMR